jgi:protein TonB
MATADIEEDITIAPTTFEDNPVEDLPPPPEEQATDLSAAPTFTPFTVAPSILNRNEVVRAMEREYPPLLRDAGIGGTVMVYFFIDENGSVQDNRVHETSGHQALDDAALAVAAQYRFSAALNRDKKVPVWVSFPITFQVR